MVGIASGSERIKSTPPRVDRLQHEIAATQQIARDTKDANAAFTQPFPPSGTFPPLSIHPGRAFLATGHDEAWK